MRAAKPVTESVRIVIRTECGNRLCYEGKGSVVHGMAGAFSGLSLKRQAALLETLQKTHAEMTAEAAKRSAP